MTQVPASSSIAGTVLPLGRAEELIATLQSVVSARIVAGESGHVEAVHVLVSGELTPKQVVRNIESALIAQLGMKVDHRKISVATTVQRSRAPEAKAGAAPPPEAVRAAPVAPQAQGVGTYSVPAAVQAPPMRGAASLTSDTASRERPVQTGPVGRQLYFEDVEIRGSRIKGSTCRVTLRRGESSWVGEADGVESTRTRPELAARAALAAIRNFEGNRRLWDLLGVRRVDAFETEFVFVGIETWVGRERVLLTGSCETKDSAETSAVLAVLDATNRWLGGDAEGEVRNR
jgi:hypothetical protein